MYLVASVCPSIRLSVTTLITESLPLSFKQGVSLPVRGLCLFVCNQRAYADNLIHFLGGCIIH